MTLRIMTMNVRNSGARDGKNIWANRKDLVRQVLHTHNPDMIGFQEPLLDQMRDLRAMLPEYDCVGVAREDGQEQGEFNPLFVKNMVIARTGTLWLSDTPAVPSCTWGGLTRICTWAAMSAPVPLLFLNTHIDHKARRAQLNSMDLLIATAQEYADRMPVVLTGDFNYNPNSPPYTRLAASMRDSYLEDPRQADDHSVTFHGFSGRKSVHDPEDGRTAGEGRIDYIWLKGDVRVECCRILHDQPGDDPDLYPSDHWPVLCDLMVY